MLQAPCCAPKPSSWLDVLERDPRERPHLKILVAQKIANEGLASSWSVEPLAGGYAAGLSTAADAGFIPITDGRGEPLTFTTIADAREFLRGTLQVPVHVPITARTIDTAELREAADDGVNLGAG